MSCNPLIDKDGKIVGWACGSRWGIGIYDSGDPEFGTVYGFPPDGIDPHDFTPDYESCTKKEIEAWEQAKRECTVHQKGER